MRSQVHTTLPCAPANVDVLIIGGGPAASSLAIRLKQNTMLSVSIVEQTDFDSPRVGESLPPNAVHFLEELGVDVTSHSLITLGVRCRWASHKDEVNDFLLSSLGYGYSVTRNEFDRLLARHAQSVGANLLTNTKYLGSTAIQPVRRSGFHWLTELQHRSGESHSVRSKFIVDATGRNAVVARSMNSKKIHMDRLIGIYQQFDGPSVTQNMLSLEAHQLGWWYATLTPESKYIVALMTDSDIAHSHQLNHPDSLAQLSGTFGLKRRANLGPPKSTHFYPASSFRLDKMAGLNWLAIGDAAFSIDPLSSQGILRALQMGTEAGDAIPHHLQGNATAIPDFAKKQMANFHQQITIKNRFYEINPRWPGAKFWRRRQAAKRILPQTILKCDFATAEVSESTALLANPKFPNDLLRELCSLCQCKRPAVDLLRDFRSKNNNVYSDSHLLAATRHLIDFGIVTTA